MNERKEAGELSETELADRGIEAVEQGDITLGLHLLMKIPEAGRTPTVRSYIASCRAMEGGPVDETLRACGDAMDEEPRNPVHYLNMGRIYLAAGDKKEAIRMFRDGLLFGESRLIRAELNKLGWRTPPVFPSLGREHLLNRFSGRLLKMLRLRD